MSPIEGVSVGIAEPEPVRIGGAPSDERVWLGASVPDEELLVD